jgi:hypothetical protein
MDKLNQTKTQHDMGSAPHSVDEDMSWLFTGKSLLTFIRLQSRSQRRRAHVWEDPDQGRDLDQRFDAK